MAYSIASAARDCGLRIQPLPRPVDGGGNGRFLRVRQPRIPISPQIVERHVLDLALPRRGRELVLRHRRQLIGQLIRQIALGFRFLDVRDDFLFGFLDVAWRRLILSLADCSSASKPGAALMSQVWYSMPPCLPGLSCVSSS